MTGTNIDFSTVDGNFVCTTIFDYVNHGWASTYGIGLSIPSRGVYGNISFYMDYKANPAEMYFYQRGEWVKLS